MSLGDRAPGLGPEPGDRDEAPACTTSFSATEPLPRSCRWGRCLLGGHGAGSEHPRRGEQLVLPLGCRGRSSLQQTAPARSLCRVAN